MQVGKAPPVFLKCTHAKVGVGCGGAVVGRGVR